MHPWLKSSSWDSVPFREDADAVDLARSLRSESGFVVGYLFAVNGPVYGVD